MNMGKVIMSMGEAVELIEGPLSLSGAVSLTVAGRGGKGSGTAISKYQLDLFRPKFRESPTPQLTTAGGT